MGKQENDPIYLDYNATTPMDRFVREAIKEANDELWGNPSSRYEKGARAKQKVEEARESIMKMLRGGDDVSNAKNQVTFTSGGTESNHLALHSAIQDCLARMKSSRGPADVVSIPHVVTTNIEHVAIDLPLRKWQADGVIEVTFVEVCKTHGRVKIDDVMDALKPNTCLVTIMMANNETGVVQPVKEIAVKIKELNVKREAGDNLFPVLVHTDASQAIGKIPMILDENFPVDYVTICGHKFYGPRIGALYHRAGSPIHPVFLGGGQEYGRRAGTENVPAIVGLGVAAVHVAARILNDAGCQRILRNYLEERLIETFGEEIRINFPRVDEGFRDLEYRLPNTTSVSFKSVSGKELLDACQGRVEASTISACHSSNVGSEGSMVLVRSGLDEGRAKGTIRFSIGRYTERKELNEAVDILKEALTTLKK